MGNNSVYLSMEDFCQSAAKTPMNVGEPWATIGRAANIATVIEGHTEYSGCSDLSRSSAGRWIDIPDGDYLSGGSGVMLWPNHSVEPAIEKEARLRSQQNLVVCSTQSRRRVVQRKSDPLWSRATTLIFRSGKTPDCTMQQEPQGWGAKRLRHPAPNSLP